MRYVRDMAVFLEAIVLSGAVYAAVTPGATDARLDRRYPAGQEFGALDTHLKKLREASGVELAPSRELRDEQMIVLNPGGSMRSAMNAIQHLFASAWREERTPPRYWLVITRAERQQRSDARAAAERRGRERMYARMRQVREWAFMSPERLSEVARADPGMVRSIRHKTGGPSVKLAFSLPSSLWAEALRTGRSRSLPVRDLPPAVQELAVQGHHFFNGINTKEDLLQRGRVSLQLGGPPDRPTIWMSCRDPRIGSDLNVLFAEGWSREPPETRRGAALDSPSPVPTNPRFRRRITVRDSPKRKETLRGERPPGARPLLELLRQIAAQVPVPLAAACEHRDPPAPGAPPTPVREYESWLQRQWWLAREIRDEPAARALDLLCADFELEWRFDEGWLRIRPRRWYLPPEKRFGSEPVRSDPPPR